MTDEPLLWMTHPGIPGIESQVTTQEGFDEIWEPRGWELIPYGVDPEVPPAHLTEALLGVPNGIAELDGTGKVVAAQIPPGVGGDAATLQTFTAANLRTRSTHTGTQTLDTTTDTGTRVAMTPAERTKLSGVATGATANSTDAVLLDRSNHTGLDDPVTPAPSTEVGYAEITADITGIVVDALNIDIISGLSITIPSIATPVYITADVVVSSNTANATMAAIICKTSPTPTTILNSIGRMGFCALSAVGSKGTSSPFARLPASTPCTVQVYLSGAGTAAVHAASGYSPCSIRAWTV